MSTDEHDHGPTAQLLDAPFCVTCGHPHIGTIPATTFRCTGGDRPCGFGCWGATVAAAHAVNYPDHIVYPLLHTMTAEVAPPSQTSEDRGRGHSLRTEPERRRCSQPDCPGDGRYMPPGKGHLPGCIHDAVRWTYKLIPAAPEVGGQGE